MTRDLICGPCFELLEFRYEDSLPGLLEALDGAPSTCLVCGLDFPHLPDGTPNVDLVLSEKLIRQLAAKNRLLQNALKDHLHEVPR